MLYLGLTTINTLFSVNAGYYEFLLKNFTGRISAQYIRSDSEGRPAQGANDSNLLIPLINGIA